MAPASVLFVKVDVDDNPDLAGHFGVQGIPAMIRFEHGEEVARLIGFRPREEIERFSYPD